MLPSLRLILFILLAAPLFLVGHLSGFFTGLGIVYLFILSVYLFFDIVRLPNAKYLIVRRSIPERISIGYATRVSFFIENLTRQSLYVSIAENLPDTISADPSVCHTIVRPGQKTTCSYTLTASIRGRFRLSRIYVRFLPAMGLLYRQFKVDITDELKVFPNVMNIKQFELLTKRSDSLNEGISRLQLMGKGSEFESLRRYIPGDALSSIDWKATAKRNRLIVRNYQPERQQNVMIAIDVGRATVGEFGGISRLDYLVNATLMLAYTVLRQKDHFSLLAFSDKIERYLPPISGVKNIDRVSRALFELTPRLVESDYGAACQFIGLKNRKRSLLCIMTDIIGKEASSIIIAYLSRFARYHLPLAITLANPEVTALANAPLAACQNPYAKAIALDHLEARQEALTLMRQKGIGVLDVMPDALIVSLINRYVLIKSQNRL